jgi:hypothetical protein
LSAFAAICVSLSPHRSSSEQAIPGAPCARLRAKVIPSASRVLLKADKKPHQGKRKVKSGIVRAAPIETNTPRRKRVICTDQYISAGARAPKRAFMRITAEPPLRGRRICHHFHFGKFCLFYRSMAARIRIS